MFFNNKWLQVGISLNFDFENQTNLHFIALEKRKEKWNAIESDQFVINRKLASYEQLFEQRDLLLCLKGWYKRLPKKHVLRLALPLDKVLQQDQPIADPRLTGKAREMYILSQAAKHFPLDANRLCIDYSEMRQSAQKASSIKVSVAKSSHVNLWKTTFEKIGFNLTNLEIAPTALRRFSRLFPNLSNSYITIHAYYNTVFWCTGGNLSFDFGVLDLTLPIKTQVDTKWHAYPIYIMAADSVLHKLIIEEKMDILTPESIIVSPKKNQVFKPIDTNAQLAIALAIGELPYE